MKIIRITILHRRNGSDLISLETSLPPAEFGAAGLDLTFHAAKGTGKAFVETNFPNVPIEEISEPTITSNFSKR
jgi:hypothetical protein